MTLEKRITAGDENEQRRRAFHLISDSLIETRTFLGSRSSSRTNTARSCSISHVLLEIRESDWSVPLFSI